MKMAKATDEDIQVVSDFFNMLEALTDPYFDIKDWVDHEWHDRFLSFMNDNYNPEVDFNKFVKF